MTNYPKTILGAMLRLQKLFAKNRTWTQGTFRNRKANHTCYCIIGGVQKVAPYHIQEAVEVMGFLDRTEAYDWNDTDGRTIKDIRERVALDVKNARKLSKQKSTEKSQ